MIRDETPQAGSLISRRDEWPANRRCSPTWPRVASKCYAEGRAVEGPSLRRRRRSAGLAVCCRRGWATMHAGSSGPLRCRRPLECRWPRLPAAVRLPARPGPVSDSCGHCDTSIRDAGASYPWWTAAIEVVRTPSRSRSGERKGRLVHAARADPDVPPDRASPRQATRFPAWSCPRTRSLPSSTPSSRRLAHDHDATLANDLQAHVSAGQDFVITIDDGWTTATPMPSQSPEPRLRATYFVIAADRSGGFLTSGHLQRSCRRERSRPHHGPRRSGRAASRETAYEIDAAALESPRSRPLARVFRLSSGVVDNRVAARSPLRELRIAVTEEPVAPEAPAHEPRRECQLPSRPGRPFVVPRVRITPNTNPHT